MDWEVFLCDTGMVKVWWLLSDGWVVISGVRGMRALKSIVDISSGMSECVVLVESIAIRCSISVKTSQKSKLSAITSGCGGNIMRSWRRSFWTSSPSTQPESDMTGNRKSVTSFIGDGVKVGDICWVIIPSDQSVFIYDSMLSLNRPPVFCFERIPIWRLGGVCVLILVKGDRSDSENINKFIQGRETIQGRR